VRPLKRSLDRIRSADLALYEAVAGRPTPRLDRLMREVSRAADYSKLSLTAAGVLAVGGGKKGRSAALGGMASVAVTAAVVNVAIKPLSRRRRPDRGRASVPFARHVNMPRSRSFPSGHTAAAFAFAVGAGREVPRAAPPLLALATLVGYSRIHTGVHYPGDVVAGALCGIAFAEVTGRLSDQVM
jgi:membrane-associated phospholipid phosphatase